MDDQRIDELAAIIGELQAEVKQLEALVADLRERVSAHEAAYP
jgi:outer membrane murein-binding lipoprotein Lpp